MRKERWSGQKSSVSKPLTELLLTHETERKGDEAGKVTGTPDHGSLEGQADKWEALKVEAGGGASGGSSQEDREEDGEIGGG